MPTILVVDDEIEVARLVERIMAAEGHDVLVAHDGTGALEKAAEVAPDLIILDINLPGIDGFEVCRRLKSDDRTRAIPVVMMTAAQTSVEDADRGTSLGADEYVVKPFVREVLVHNVRRLLEPAQDQ
jgi:DNA-binding response OmpR family regulator